MFTFVIWCIGLYFIFWIVVALISARKYVLVALGFLGCGALTVWVFYSWGFWAFIALWVILALVGAVVLAVAVRLNKSKQTEYSKTGWKWNGKTYVRR